MQYAFICQLIHIYTVIWAQFHLILSYTHTFHMSCTKYDEKYCRFIPISEEKKEKKKENNMEWDNDVYAYIKCIFKWFFFFFQIFKIQIYFRMKMLISSTHLFSFSFENPIFAEQFYIRFSQQYYYSSLTVFFSWKFALIKKNRFNSEHSWENQSPAKINILIKTFHFFFRFE